MAFYLKNAHVLDVEKGTFFSADVKIENKKIVSLDEKAPDGADAVDCTGKYLTPGVMDAHVHLVWDGTSRIRWGIPSKTATMSALQRVSAAQWIP